jgi:hypothetical protein
MKKFEGSLTKCTTKEVLVILGRWIRDGRSRLDQGGEGEISGRLHCRARQLAMTGGENSHRRS